MVGQQEQLTGNRKEVVVGVGSGERLGINRHQDHSELRSGSTLGNFSYPGHSFTPTLTSCGQSSPAPERNKPEEQDGPNTSFPRCFSNLNDNFLGLTFSTPQPKKVGPSENSAGQMFTNIYPPLPGSGFSPSPLPHADKRAIALCG